MRTINEILERSGWSKEDFDMFWFSCYLDYSYFAKYVLGFQVEDFHKEWFELARRFKRLCIIAHRGSGKTFWFSGYLIWLSIFHPNSEFLIVSNNLEHSKYILKVIKLLIQDNGLLNQLVPKNRDKSWRQTEITTTTNCTFYVRTYGESIRGIHPDFALCDEGGQYEDKTIFWQVISPTLNMKNGRMIVVGTPKSYADLLMELYNENREYMSKKYPAIIKTKEGKKALWPAKYTLNKKDIFNRKSLIKIKREIGEINFEQEYMLNPVSAQTSLFPYDLIQKAINSNDSFNAYSKPNKRYVIGCDIAFSKKVKGDFSVFTVLEINPDRSKKIVYIERMKGVKPSEQKEILKDMIGRFHPYRVMIDEVGVGQAFIKDIKKEITGTQIEGYTVNSPTKKNELLKSLRNEFENNRIIIPHSNKHSKTYSLSSILIKELEETGWVIKSGKAKITGLGRHDDTVSSLALANLATQNSIGRVSISAV